MKRAEVPGSIEADPRRRKWLVLCVACRTVGRRPDIPDDAHRLADRLPAPPLV